MEFRNRINHSERDLVEQIKNASPILDVALKIGAISEQYRGAKHYQGPCFMGHQSSSGSCLSINSSPPLFHCFNCKIGGDVIEMVRLAKFKDSSKGFRDSLRYLAQKAGYELPQLSISEIEKHEFASHENQTAIAVLTVAADYFSSQLSQKLRIYLNDRGINDQTIASFKVGYASGDGLLHHLRRKGFSDIEAISSGLFTMHNSRPEEFFKKRLTLPYISQDRVYYFVGRETDETTDQAKKSRKYVKLQTFKESRSYIAKIVRSIIFNQDAVFHANPLFITEGFFDCLILQQNGFETISPGTVSFSNRELQILCSILPKQTQVYLCNDNELNRAGEKGAVAMAIHLAKNGYNVRIANIPLKESHIDARRKLEELNRGS